MGPLRGHGGRQRDARLLLRRRSLVRHHGRGQARPASGLRGRGPGGRGRRVDPPGRQPGGRVRGAAPGDPGRAGPGLRRRHRLRGHHARPRRRTGRRRRGRPGQRRQRRPRRPGHDPGRRRRRCPVRRDALARLQRVDEQPRGVRGRRRRGPRRAAAADGRGGRGRGRPGTRRDRPRPRLREGRRPRPETRRAPGGAAHPGPPAAGGRLPQTFPRPRPGRAGQPPAARPRTRRGHRRRLRPRRSAGAWAVRVHEVRATADAVRVARAVEGAA
ncbi:hypothetical protein SBADM41S_01770 [Streptomyces badius]